MDTTNSRAGLMSGIAMAVYGSTPSDLGDEGEGGRSGTRARALRHARLRAMMQGDPSHGAQRHRANRLLRGGLDD